MCRTSRQILEWATEVDGLINPAIMHSAQSHYDPSTNRCYADLTSQQPDHTRRGLYDAQTRDLLASSSIDQDKRNGSVFEAGRPYMADGNARFDDANDYINNKMADDRKR